MTFNSSSGLIDTHCHLNLDEFNQDRSQVIQRAWENGVEKILIPGLDIDSSKTAISLAQEYPQVYAAVGVHPNSDQDWRNDTLIELQTLTRNNKVVAIGEIGLDYYRDHTPRRYQRSIFAQQLDLAASLGLPVIIHNREASEDMKEMLKDWHASLIAQQSELSTHPGVLHAFSGDEKFAFEMTRLNFKLGIDGPVTFRNSQVLQNVVKVLPLDNLLLETDAPYLSPHPFRGRRNEPVNVRIVAEKIAVLKTIAIADVAEVTTKEANKLFNWRFIK